MTHYHFIGIGGTGLSAIARVLFERGEHVSGSDLCMSPIAEELTTLGISVSEGHNKENIGDANMIIRSSAISDDNPEVLAAIEKDIPVLKRREFLKILTKGKKVIAIAGTHGKTTTTAMTTWCLSESGLEPSYVIGSVSKNLGKNAAAGSGEYFVIEADEYDNMFLGLNPYILVITNIEHDHPDCFPTEQAYCNAFQKLTDKIVLGGYLIAYGDDKNIQALLNNVPESTNVITYGKTAGSDLQILSAAFSDLEKMKVEIKNHAAQPHLPNEMGFSLGLPGLHNALDATAAYAASIIAGADANAIKHALAGFSGSGRRFDILGQVNGVTIIDDYGHHPTEIKATLSAARDMFKEKVIWAVWQPHTYSRTQELYEDFMHAFSDCDHVLVTEIYRSREPLQDYSARQLVDKMPHSDKHFKATLQETEDFLKANLKTGDVLIVFSAGDANQISQNIFEGKSSEEIQ